MGRSPAKKGNPLCLCLLAVGAILVAATGPIHGADLPGGARKNRHLVYLTLDGGPSAAFSAKVLPVLDAHRCHVTWFVVGEHLIKDRSAAGVIARAGHKLEVHTWSHRSLTTLDNATITKEIRYTAGTIFEQTGHRPSLVRPPYGDHDRRTDMLIVALGYRTVMWDIDYPDYHGGRPEDLVRSITGRVWPGAIVLLHVTRLTWQALPALLIELDKKGYQYALLPKGGPQIYGSQGK